MQKVSVEAPLVLLKGNINVILYKAILDHFEFPSEDFMPNCWIQVLSTPIATNYKKNLADLHSYPNDP